MSTRRVYQQTIHITEDETGDDPEGWPRRERFLANPWDNLRDGSIRQALMRRHAEFLTLPATEEQNNGETESADMIFERLKNTVKHPTHDDWIPEGGHSSTSRWQEFGPRHLSNASKWAVSVATPYFLQKVSSGEARGDDSELGENVSRTPPPYLSIKGDGLKGEYTTLANHNSCAAPFTMTILAQTMAELHSRMTRTRPGINLTEAVLESRFSATSPDVLLIGHVNSSAREVLGTQDVQVCFNTNSVFDFKRLPAHCKQKLISCDAFGSLESVTFAADSHTQSWIGTASGYPGPNPWYPLQHGLSKKRVGSALGVPASCYRTDGREVTSAISLQYLPDETKFKNMELIVDPERAFALPSEAEKIRAEEAQIELQHVKAVLRDAFGERAHRLDSTNSFSLETYPYPVSTYAPTEFDGDDRQCAASSAADGGKHHLTGKVTPRFAYGESCGGGYGAGPGWHGVSATHVHGTNTRMTDIEIVERRIPVILRHVKIRRGTGGRGEYNGGDGMSKLFEARQPCSFSIVSQRRVFAPRGENGGEDGAEGANTWRRRLEDGSYSSVNVGSNGMGRLLKGDQFQVDTPGGGGWGYVN
ncbi:hypothetical protein V866_007918 [Kwoniella sp. B9012]